MCERAPLRTALSRGPASSLPELAARHLEEYRDKIHLALDHLDSAAIWWRPHPGTNSVGNLIIHLCGNLSLWLVAGVGDGSYQRRRSEEFAARPGREGDAADPALAARSGSELLDALDDTVARCCEMLRDLAPEQLTEPISIQGYDLDVRGAIIHPLEHMSYHTGQILYVTKLLSEDADIELYPQHRDE